MTAGRPRRPGDQGGEPVGDELGLGSAVPGGRRRAAGVDVLPLGQPQQGVGHPRPEAPTTRTVARPASAPTCSSRTSGWGRRTGSGLPVAAAGAQPATRGPVDHRLRHGLAGPEASRAGFGQIAQGEGGLMSLTGLTEPTKVGVPIADLLAGMNGATGVLAALEREHTRAGCPHLLAVGRGRRARLPGRGGPWPARCPASAAAPSVDGAVPGALRRPRPRSRSPARRLAGLADSLTRRAGHQRERVAHRDRAIALIESRLADGGGGAERLADAGVPAGKVRTLDDVYTGPDALPRAPPGRRAPHARADHLPGPCASTTTPMPADGELTSLPRHWASTTRRCGRGSGSRPPTREAGSPQPRSTIAATGPPPSGP